MNAEVRVVNVGNDWSVTLSVGEIDGETDAEAYLVITENDRLVGRGRARLNPADRNVTKIGAEIAVARALSDLSHRLLHAAATDIEGMTHERAHLHM